MGKRYSSKTMKARVVNNELIVMFMGGETCAWRLPEVGDVDAIRRVRETAVSFAAQQGATVGQQNAVRKALSAHGYHVRLPRS